MPSHFKPLQTIKSQQFFDSCLEYFGMFMFKVLKSARKDVRLDTSLSHHRTLGERGTHAAIFSAMCLTQSGAGGNPTLTSGNKALQTLGAWNHEG